MLKVGDKCSFYHEGGAGDRRWVVGWRFGIIRALPAKGAKKNWAQIELPIKAFTWDDAAKKWLPRAVPRVWVHSNNVNPVGDHSNHAPRLVEVVKERKAEKKKQQAKADKRRKRAA